MKRPLATGSFEHQENNLRVNVSVSLTDVGADELDDTDSLLALRLSVHVQKHLQEALARAFRELVPVGAESQQEPGGER